MDEELLEAWSDNPDARINIVERDRDGKEVRVGYVDSFHVDYDTLGTNIVITVGWNT